MHDEEDDGNGAYLYRAKYDRPSGRVAISERIGRPIGRKSRLTAMTKWRLQPLAIPDVFAHPRRAINILIKVTPNYVTSATNRGCMAIA